MTRSGDSVIEIRRADPSDHVALSAIRRSAILELAVVAMSPSQAEQWANQAAADRVTRAILHHAVWVAVQGAPIGWVEVDEDRVAALYVAPQCSGRGVGYRLVLRAEAAIRDGGYAAARLETFPNTATFDLHRGYFLSEARTADGAFLLSKRLSEHRHNPPLQPIGSAGG
ncbi:MAG: GNAT family N-acetyltransferase [Betaproteobacteria bacterium]|nr:MAG: GNAT family N-acetyltransferase [Betaproteobacteria bacterium]